MKKALASSLIVLFTFSIMGCTMARISGRGATPVLINNPPERVEVIKHFKISKGITFDWTSSFDASGILAEVVEETDCDAIINAGFTVKMTVGDYFINLFTLGLANAMHLQVEADAIKAPNGLGLEMFENPEVLAESDNLEKISALALTVPDSEGQATMILKESDSYKLVTIDNK